MKFRLSHLFLPVILAILAPLPACSEDGESQDDAGMSPGPSGGQDAGDSSAGDSGTGGGSGAAGSGGMSPDAGITAGSGGSGAGGGDGGSTGISDIDPTFETLKFVMNGYRPDINCAASDCHSGGHDHSAVPLRLVDDDQLHQELLTHTSAKCGNIPAVDPGNPENSALLRLLKGPCGEPADAENFIPRMPFGCFEDEWENNCVSDEYIAAIEQWIARGAPEHED
jgi:hypothetical protein